MSARLRAGVIGTGQWARAAHLPAFASLPGIELVALAGIDPAEVASAAAEFGAAKSYASGRDLLAHERLDLVSIVTPDDRHAEDAALALAAGVHVLCEKPLASTLADARTLAVQAARSSVRTKMGFSLRYAPAVAYLRELVQSGEFGDVRLVQGFQQNGQFLDPAKPFHWKMDRDVAGGGAIVEYGVHTIDLMRWIAGEVTRVSATTRTHVPSRPAPDGTRAVEVDDSAAVLLDFERGAIGMLHAGWSTVGRPPGLEFRVFGSQGAVRCALADDLPGGESVWLANARDQHFEPVAVPDRLSAMLPADLPWWRSYTLALIRDFVAEITGDAPPSATFADGLAAQRVLDAILTALCEDRWVDVPD
jgi:predicted dehydrogenase